MAAKQKLFALGSFPSLQQAITVCRSEESARSNVRELDGQPAIGRVPVYQKRYDRKAASDLPTCATCGGKPHGKDTICPAIGKKCYKCNRLDHLAKCCPGTKKSIAAVGLGSDTTDTLPGGSYVGSIALRSINGQHRRRRAPTTRLQLLNSTGKTISTVSATADGSAEVIVAGTDVLRSMGLTDRDLRESKFDLVQADKSTQLLSIGQLDIPVRYETSEVVLTVVFCPDINGMLISWLVCIALGILHRDYPRPVFYPSPLRLARSVHPHRQFSITRFQSSRRRRTSVRFDR